MNHREAWANGEIEAGTLVDAIEEQARKIASLKGVNEHLRMQAKIQAQEARTQKSIVSEIGAMVGEPMDFLTAGAVRDALKAQPSGVVLSGEYHADVNMLLARLNACQVSADLIRFDFTNAQGQPDSKMITHDEMRQRYNDLLISNAGGDAFCDDHCTWLDHHPSCARAAGATVKDCLTAGGVVLPDNLVSHRGTWLQALERLIELEPETTTGEVDDKSYWRHELQAMRDMYADLERLTAGRAAQLALPPMIEFDELVNRLFELDADARKYCAVHWLLSMWKATLDRVCELNAGRAAVPDSEQVREGWQVVPLEPTPAMVKAAASAITTPDNLPPIGDGWTMSDLAFRSRYQAAIAAAPSAGSQKEQE